MNIVFTFDDGTQQTIDIDDVEGGLAVHGQILKSTHKPGNETWVVTRASDSKAFPGIFATPHGAKAMRAAMLASLADWELLSKAVPGKGALRDLQLLAAAIDDCESDFLDALAERCPEWSKQPETEDE